MSTIDRIMQDGQVLTLESAKSLMGKTICWSYIGAACNETTLHESTISEIVSELDFYSREPMEGYESRAAYWKSYMSKAQLREKERTLIILDEKGRNTYMFCQLDSSNYPTPTFCCSDADREVYFIEK